MRNNETYENLLKSRLDSSDLSTEEFLSIYNQSKRNKIETLKDEIDRLKLKNDELDFVIGGEEYKKYINWRHDIETKINRQELKTGKRAVDEAKLSDDDLDKIRQSLEQGEPKVFYGCYLLHYFDGHNFNFHLNDSTYSITVVNQLTKDTINLGEGYFYRFSDFYYSMNSLIPDVKLGLLDKIALKLFNRSKIEPLTKDYEIYEKWKELTKYNSFSENEYEKLIFTIDSEQHKDYQAWKEEKNIKDCYFSFEETNFGSLDSAVNLITGEKIDLTDIDSW